VKHGSQCTNAGAAPSTHTPCCRPSLSLVLRTRFSPTNLSTKPRASEPLPIKAAEGHERGKGGRTISWGKEKVRREKIRVRAKTLTREKLFDLHLPLDNRLLGAPAGRVFTIDSIREKEDLCKLIEDYTARGFCHMVKTMEEAEV